MWRFYHEQKNMQLRRAGSQSKDSGVVVGKQHWQYGGHPKLVQANHIDEFMENGLETELDESLGVSDFLICSLIARSSCRNLLASVAE